MLKIVKTIKTKLHY